MTNRKSKEEISAQQLKSVVGGTTFKEMKDKLKDTLGEGDTNSDKPKVFTQGGDNEITKKGGESPFETGINC